MKKKTVKPDRICFECQHYEACQSWNIGSLVRTAADNCVNYRASVDVRSVVRGKWIDTDNYYQRWKCSVCGCHTRDAAPNFCPNCGANMRGGEAGE